MHDWRVIWDRKTGGFRHALPKGVGHAMLVPAVTHMFELLRVSATLWDGSHWWPLHSEPNVIGFEVAHDADPERYRYNDRNIALVVRTGKLVRGAHAGWSDTFVPMRLRGTVAAVLVVGPFATSRPTGAGLLARWHQLAGYRGELSDVDFLAYVQSALSTLVVERPALQALEGWLGCLGSLMASEGSADELMNRADALRLELERARFTERMWDATHALIDERSSQTQYRAKMSPETRG